MIVDGYAKRYITIWLDGDDNARLSLQVIRTNDIDTIDLTPNGSDVTDWLEIVPYETA